MQTDTVLVGPGMLVNVEAVTVVALPEPLALSKVMSSATVVKMPVSLSVDTLVGTGVAVTVPVGVGKSVKVAVPLGNDPPGKKPQGGG